MNVRICQYYDKNDRCPRWVAIPVKNEAEGKALVETLRMAIKDDLTTVSLLLW